MLKPAEQMLFAREGQLKFIVYAIFFVDALREQDNPAPLLESFRSRENLQAPASSIVTTLLEFVRCKFCNQPVRLGEQRWRD